MHELTGTMLIGDERVRGDAGEVRSIEAAGMPLDRVDGGGVRAEADRACALADAAFDAYRATIALDRARFLQAIGDELIVRVLAESGLPRVRLDGERGRTVGQSKPFATVLRNGGWEGLRINPVQPDCVPIPRPNLRLREIAIGPVAVFGASNLPPACHIYEHRVNRRRGVCALADQEGNVPRRPA